MNRFFHATALNSPESVRPFLADPIHWKKGRSAFELAHSWISAKGIPKIVGDVLDTCTAFQDAILLEGFFEHETPLRSAGGPTHTDLLALVQLSGGVFGVIAVEGKAGEDFGPIIQVWNDRPGTEQRLQILCEYFGLGSETVNSLRYQLLHRTAAAMFEAERYGAAHAMTLIHSFDRSDETFKDYVAFVKALGLRVPARNRVTDARKVHGIELSLAWVDDQPKA